jgi:hypothetical protein
METIIAILFTILMFLFCSIAIILNIHKEEIWDAIKTTKE